jgi:hypothetical protein
MAAAAFSHVSVSPATAWINGLPSVPWTAQEVPGSQEQRERLVPGREMVPELLHLGDRIE